MPTQPYSRDRSSLFGTSLYILVGPLVWALHMTAVYSVHTLFCTVGLRQTVLLGLSPSAFFIVAATIVAVGIVAVFALPRQAAARLLLVPPDDAPIRPFLDGLMLWLGFLSAAGILWSGTTMLVLDACAQLR